MTNLPSDRDVLSAQITQVMEGQKRILELLEKLLEQRGSARPGQLIQEKAVAERLKVSIQTLRRYRAKGVIGFVRVGGHVLYRPEHIDEFITSREHRQRVGRRRASATDAGHRV